MKKTVLFLFCFLVIILLSGCSMDNTPTKKVENFLNSYRTLDETVVGQMNDIVNEDTLMNDTQRQTYKDILTKQYQDLNYTVKDEKIDGDNAIVTVEVEVYDFFKATEESDSYYETNLDEFKDETGNLSDSKYIDYRLDRLKKMNEKVKYTIDFSLRKVDDAWMMNEIDDTTRQKIHGLYAY